MYMIYIYIYIYVYVYIYICICIYIYIYIYICNPGHRVSRPQGTGSVGDSVGEGACVCIDINVDRYLVGMALRHSGGKKAC